MRCYKVIAKQDGKVIASRIAGTNALARETRDKLIAQFELRKKDVEIENAEVPVQKDALIDYLNEVLEKQDVKDDGDE